MLSLFDFLYGYVQEDGLRFLPPEEAEDFRAAVSFRDRQEQQIGELLASEQNNLWKTYLGNTQQANEEERWLAFRRGLALGLKLGALTSWAP